MPFFINKKQNKMPLLSLGCKLRCGNADSFSLFLHIFFMELKMLLYNTVTNWCLVLCHDWKIKKFRILFKESLKIPTSKNWLSTMKYDVVESCIRSDNCFHGFNHRKKTFLTLLVKIHFNWKEKSKHLVEKINLAEHKEGFQIFMT